MRNYFALIALSSLVFLVGCGQKQEYIEVQGFSFLANTIISNTNYDNVSVYVIDNTRTNSGDMMTVLSQPIDPSAASGSWVESNIITLQQTYPTITITEQPLTLFSCLDDEIQGTLVLGTMPTTPEKDPLYFVQHFFIHRGIGYVFTYSSSNEKSALSMGDNWQRTRCSPL